MLVVNSVAMITYFKEAIRDVKMIPNISQEIHSNIQTNVMNLFKAYASLLLNILYFPYRYSDNTLPVSYELYTVDGKMRDNETFRIPIYSIYTTLYTRLMNSIFIVKSNSPSDIPSIDINILKNVLSDFLFNHNYSYDNPIYTEFLKQLEINKLPAIDNYLNKYIYSYKKMNNKSNKKVIENIDCINYLHTPTPYIKQSMYTLKIYAIYLNLIIKHNTQLTVGTQNVRANQPTPISMALFGPSGMPNTKTSNDRTPVRQTIRQLRNSKLTQRKNLNRPTPISMALFGPSGKPNIKIPSPIKVMRQTIRQLRNSKANQNPTLTENMNPSLFKPIPSSNRLNNKAAERYLSGSPVPKAIRNPFGNSNSNNNSINEELQFANANTTQGTEVRSLSNTRRPSTTNSNLLTQLGISRNNYRPVNPTFKSQQVVPKTPGNPTSKSQPGTISTDPRVIHQIPPAIKRSNLFEPLPVPIIVPKIKRITGAFSRRKTRKNRNKNQRKTRRR